MNELRQLEAKGLARAKARSRRLRHGRIRKGTIRGSLALFAVLWALIFAQLVSGSDPALSRTKPHHRLSAAAKSTPEPEAEPVYEQAPAYEPEVEFEEPLPEAEPEPVVTSSS